VRKASILAPRLAAAQERSGPRKRFCGSGSPARLVQDSRATWKQVWPNSGKNLLPAYRNVMSDITREPSSDFRAWRLIRSDYSAAVVLTSTSGHPSGAK
jgi:hypothetical protein